jgi:MFS family permease
MPQTLLFGSIPLSFVLGGVSSFLMGIWVPQSMAMSVALSPLRMRTVAAAVWSSLYSLVGLGLGPYLVGELNVRFEPSSGVGGIRYSLASVMAALGIAAIFQLLAAHRLMVDLARTRAMESDGGTEYGRA